MLPPGWLAMVRRSPAGIIWPPQSLLCADGQTNPKFEIFGTLFQSPRNLGIGEELPRPGKLLPTILTASQLIEGGTPGRSIALGVPLSPCSGYPCFLAADGRLRKRRRGPSLARCPQKATPGSRSRPRARKRPAATWLD